MGNLKSHLCNHTGEKPFQCPFSSCGKKYSRLCRLKIHQRTHTGEKPFRCTFPSCNKSFNEKGNLKTHYRIHTGEKPYACSHEGCDQAFKAHGHLKDHMKRHFNIRPYECRICKAKFARSSTLKIHYHTHTGEKPFKCAFRGCCRKFSEKGNMRTHYKTHCSGKSDEISETDNSSDEKKCCMGDTNSSNGDFSSHQQQKNIFALEKSPVNSCKNTIQMEQPIVKNEEINMNPLNCLTQTERIQGANYNFNNQSFINSNPNLTSYYPHMNMNMMNIFAGINGFNLMNGLGFNNMMACDPSLMLQNLMFGYQNIPSNVNITMNSLTNPYSHWQNINNGLIEQLKQITDQLN